MLLEVLYRIYANPTEHLGCRSLLRLQSFETGYLLSAKNGAKDYHFGSAFRDWISRLYGTEHCESARGPNQFLEEVAQDDERAFELHFSLLNSALAAHPEFLQNPHVLSRESDDGPIPVSGFLDALELHPNLFLPKLCPGCLRSFLDGVRLACLEGDHFECADLDGFEHWVRRRLNLKGMFRWENAILAYFDGAEEKSFEWCIRELKAFREATGLQSERRYKVQSIS